MKSKFARHFKISDVSHKLSQLCYNIVIIYQHNSQFAIIPNFLIFISNWQTSLFKGITTLASFYGNNNSVLGPTNKFGVSSWHVEHFLILLRILFPLWFLRDQSITYNLPLFPISINGGHVAWSTGTTRTNLKPVKLKTFIISISRFLFQLEQRFHWLFSKQVYRQSTNTVHGDCFGQMKWILFYNNDIFFSLETNQIESNVLKKTSLCQLRALNKVLNMTIIYIWIKQKNV